MAEGALIYPATTAIATVAVALCFVHARGDADRLTLLAMALIYGFLLEQGSIIAFEAYVYATDQFVVTLLDVPIAIALAWAAIIYAAIQTGTHLGLRPAQLPFFVALYALHIDIAIDAVAIRVPFWEWQTGGVWFGVPLGNFVAWYLVAILFTGSYLAFRSLTANRLLQVIGTLVASVASLLVGLELYIELIKANGLLWEVLVFVGIVVVALWVIGRESPRQRPAPLPRSILTVGLLFHLYFLVLLVGLGIYRIQPWLVVIAVAMLGLTIWMHWLPTRQHIPRPKTKEV
ncbi:MAG: carotenoid biosynthesis protein [Halobacteriales archaeon]|nr:carotenoid biosynthesis protein [Halobacteriales archaeon]